jgi:hypothetical protein
MGHSFIPAILPHVYKAKIVQHVHGLASFDMCKYPWGETVDVVGDSGYGDDFDVYSSYDDGDGGIGYGAGGSGSGCSVGVCV